MKQYEKPLIEIKVYDNEDIILTSGGLQADKYFKDTTGTNMVEF